MKKLFTFFCSIAIFISITSNSFSIPLNGTYTIGSGGDYATINLAVSDVVSQGVSGPVIFNIISGTYNEHIILDSIPGTSSINTVTFKSQTNNHDDVILPNEFVLNGADNVAIESISFFRNGLYSSKIRITNFCDNIKIIKNVFSKDVSVGGFFHDIWFRGGTNSLQIEENLFKLERYQVTILPAYPSSNIRITNNSFLSAAGSEIFSAHSIDAQYCDSILIEKNYFTTSFNETAIRLINCNLFYISKNKIPFGVGQALYINLCGNPQTRSVLSNNFFPRSGSAIFSNCTNLLFIYNSFYWVRSLTIYSSIDISLINNLFVNLYPFNSYAAFLFSSSNSKLNSDYNNFYNVGSSPLINYNDISYYNLLDFYNATGLDQKSNSHLVHFVDSLVDLHLTGSSIGDEGLIGIPSSIITDDIDGQPRDPFYPYKGADEADVVLPVELSSFTSIVVENNVILNWITLMESNNSGFDIERSNVTDGVNGEWSMVNFIRGIGNSNTQQNYSYEDRTLAPGKYKYRLKQIDFNGNFKYYQLSNEVLIGIPEKFSLSQNYPNPFNPVTVIRYSLIENRFVTLKVFDILGNEVAILTNEKKEAGIHSVQFDGSNLSSGVYLYRLKADGKTIDTKRMVLLK